MILQKINKKINLEYRFFVALVIVLVAVISFGLGRLSKIENSKPPIKITNPASASLGIPGNGIGQGSGTPPDATFLGQYVASKNGTKYHLPWCSGAQTIKEENKIWFNTKTDAENAGYSPASNCKGI